MHNLSVMQTIMSEKVSNNDYLFDIIENQTNRFINSVNNLGNQI